MDKRCSKCKEIKNILQFNKTKKEKSGYQYCCKQCQAISNKKWYDKNQNKICLKAKEKYLLNSESQKISQKKYYQNNIKKIRLKNSIWKKLNCKKINENNRKRYHQNSKLGVMKSRKWQMKNIDKVKNYKLKNTYNISLEEYNKLLELQNGVCEICKLPETVIHHVTKQAKQLAVDHNHTTGKIRKLLCARCNTGMGFFNDNIGLLKNVIAYLEFHNGN